MIGTVTVEELERAVLALADDVSQLADLVNRMYDRQLSTATSVDAVYADVHFLLQQLHQRAKRRPDQG